MESQAGRDAALKKLWSTVRYRNSGVETCYFCNTFHWRTWSALISVQLLIRRIIISVFIEWEWEIKMPFLKLQTILWQGNDLSFLSKEHPPSVLWLSPGAPTGHPSRNVKFALIPEKWIVNVPPWGLCTSSHLRCPLLIACLCAFAAGGHTVNKEKKKRFNWAVPLFWDLNSHVPACFWKAPGDKAVAMPVSTRAQSNWALAPA